MFYKASLDKTAITITALIGVLFLFIIVSSSVVFGTGKNIPANNHVDVYALVSGVFLAGCFFITWLFHPTGYEVMPDALLVKRPGNKITIDKKEIGSLRLLEKKEIAGANRTFGSGGFFGYFGRFNEFHLGKMTWYVTNKNNMVLLKMRDGKIYIVSPDDAPAFIKEFGKLGK